MRRTEQQQFATRCGLAGLAILALLVIVLAWWPFPSEFQHECKRIGGSFVPGYQGSADLCVGPATGAAAAPASPTAR